MTLEVNFLNSQLNQRGPLCLFGNLTTMLLNNEKADISQYITSTIHLSQNCQNQAQIG